MTTDKAFKRVVRARMAKTGERYAAARRALVQGATDGQHAEPTTDTVTPTGYRMPGASTRRRPRWPLSSPEFGVVSPLTGRR